ncbi:MAG TPA: hypothetical protein DCE71_00215 [Parachlamydiales bacterium]|nr:hypothetical protein [Parachlamydiales bacterium]
MAKCVRELRSVALTNTSNQEAVRIDLSNCNGVSFQLNSLAATSGSMRVQRSNDGTNWEDVSGATKTLTNAATNVANTLEVSPIYSGFARLLVTLAAGGGTYTAIAFGKER